MQSPKLSFLFLFIALLLPLRSETDGPLPNEFAARGGMPRVAAKLETPAAEVRVAFLGGSITAADGWRPGMMAWLRKTYPARRFTEIFAALPGTGSDFGAARLRDDVLRHAPDLLFVEFAVNDTGRDPASIRRSMEGIVRQTRLHAPGADLCFVYTLSQAGLPYVESGRCPPAAAAMEEVAAHYAIPSLHFGVEVVRQLRAGRLVFTGASPSPAIPVFAPDKIHPGAAGHRLYVESLARRFPALLAGAKSPAATLPLPAALEPANWENARLVSVAALADRQSSAWVPVSADDIRLSAIPAGLRHETFTAQNPGLVLEFSFTGSAFGLYGIKGPDAGRFRVTVDDCPPVVATLFDDFCTARRYRAKPWFYPADLPRAPHRVRIELLKDKPDKTAARAAGPADPAFDLHALNLSGVIIVGSVAP